MPIASHKVLLITNIPNPYRIPLFNKLRQQLEIVGTDLLIVFGALGYERRKFQLDMAECNFRYVVLPEKRIRYRDSERISFTYSGLLQLIRNEKPDVIITNAFSLATLKLWLRSWLVRTPYIIWSGAVCQQGNPVSLPRKLQRRLVVSRASGFIAYGSKAKKYLVDLGAREDEVSIGINTVDTEYFATETKRFRHEKKRVDNNKYLLSITYLTSRKQVETLLYIARDLSQVRSDFHLLILGDGPELERLQHLAESLGVSEFVSFEGFVQKADIPKYMAQASIFLFPTDFDIWGLVLVEAMAAGLPCIASMNAGATHDLVQEGITGFSADFNDASSVAGRINWLLDNPDVASCIGTASARLIKKEVNLEKSSAGFVQSIQYVLRDR